MRANPFPNLPVDQAGHKCSHRHPWLAMYRSSTIDDTWGPSSLTERGPRGLAGAHHPRTIKEGRCCGDVLPAWGGKVASDAIHHRNHSYAPQTWSTWYQGMCPGMIPHWGSGIALPGRPLSVGPGAVCFASNRGPDAYPAGPAGQGKATILPDRGQQNPRALSRGALTNPVVGGLWPASPTTTSTTTWGPAGET